MLKIADDARQRREKARWDVLIQLFEAVIKSNIEIARVIARRPTL